MSSMTQMAVGLQGWIERSRVGHGILSGFRSRYDIAW